MELDYHGLPMSYTSDWGQARASVERLAALEPELVVTGHGPAMRGAEMREALRTLAREFDRVAVPRARWVRGRAGARGRERRHVRAAETIAIDWKVPPPRSGLAGALDRFVGPGATRAELALQVVFPVLAAIAAPLYASSVVERWSGLQYVASSILALDAVGGVVTNATSSAKRWYHRAGQRFKQHIGFVSLHLLHLLVVSWLYLAFDLTWVVIAGAYLLVSAVVVLSVAQYLQRPVALAAYTCSLLISMYVLPQPEGLEWFLPLFYLKLLVSRLPKEEPYMPSQGS